MAGISFKIGNPTEFTEEEKLLFVDLLKLQGKVVNPTLQKVNSCKYIAACILDNAMVSIGAIKPATISDFSSAKANLPDLKDKFDWELGYCYTLPDHIKKGYSTDIVQKLIDAAGNSKLIASTEMNDSPMRRILERYGFEQKGNTWPSIIHGNELGLFLR